MRMQIINTEENTADFIMRLDEQLLFELNGKDLPILHFYEWSQPAATYGYFIEPANHLNLVEAKKWGLDLARRPTGGGIVFHIWDLAFSFLLPARHPAYSLNTLDNYRFVNQIVKEAVEPLFALDGELIPQDASSLHSQCQFFCMAKPTKYDVVYQGMKIAGAAQRRRNNGYLHQGTISLAFPNEQLLRSVLLSQEEVFRAMETHSFAPLAKGWSAADLAELRGKTKQLLEEKFIDAV